MKPYKTKKLTEGPDVADIQSEGRKSSVGRLPGNQHSYTRNAKAKAATRRSLKRADKARSRRLED